MFPFSLNPAHFLRFLLGLESAKNLCGECLKGKCCLDNLLLKSCSNLASNNLNIVIIKFRVKVGLPLNKRVNKGRGGGSILDSLSWRMLNAKLLASY